MSIGCLDRSFHGPVLRGWMWLLSCFEGVRPDALTVIADPPARVGVDGFVYGQDLTAIGQVLVVDAQGSDRIRIAVGVDGGGTLVLAAARHEQRDGECEGNDES